MFNQNNEEEKKLDWMYKGPNSTVNREEYLLGRTVDKTLEQLNEEEKQKQQNLIPTPKNRVEHECIPPSIRDFNKLVQAEQVDLSTKLQEDPLVAIKKREEESRRQFLQNPVQLKKLQKALKAQQAKKKKKKKKKKKSKHSSDSESELNVRLAEKLLGSKNKKPSKEEKQLDTILIHKFEALKDKLTESDLQDIFSGKFTDSDESDDQKCNTKSKKKKRNSSDESDDDRKQKRQKNLVKRQVSKGSNQRRRDSSEDLWKERYQDRRPHKDNSDKEFKRDNYKHRDRSSRHKSSSESDSEPEQTNYHSKKYDSDDSDSTKKNRILNYGLVSSDGKKIALSRKYSHDKEDSKLKSTKASEVPALPKRRAHKLTEEEKEKLRKEMMENAVWRDSERIRNVKQYREKDDKERKEQNFDPDFIHKQLMKSADTSSVESRIKSNLNNIQRSSRDMDRNFSRR